MPKAFLPKFVIAAMLNAAAGGARLRRAYSREETIIPLPMENGGHRPSSRQYITRPGWRAEARKRAYQKLSRRQRANRVGGARLRRAVL